MWQTLHLYLLQNDPGAIYNSVDFIILVTLWYLYELAYLSKCHGFSMVEAQPISTLCFQLVMESNFKLLVSIFHGLFWCL